MVKSLCAAEREAKESGKEKLDRVERKNRIYGEAKDNLESVLEELAEKKCPVCSNVGTLKFFNRDRIYYGEFVNPTIFTIYCESCGVMQVYDRKPKKS